MNLNPYLLCVGATYTSLQVLVPESKGFVSPSMQAQLSSHLRRTTAAPKIDLDALERFWDRALPENFDWSCEQAYQHLPSECLPLPDQECKGKYSFTLASHSGAKIEVLLRSRAFFVKKLGAGAPNWEGSQHVAWAWYPTVQACWDQVNAWIA